MVKLHARAFLAAACLALGVVAACTWTSADRYAQGELVCSDTASCDAMWSAASSWLKQNSTFKLDRTESVLETRCGRYSESFACYTLTRQPRRSGETHIHIYVACGNDFIGCSQPATQLRNALTDFMVSARPAPSPSAFGATSTR